MSATTASDRAFPVDVDLAGSVTKTLSDQVQRWSQECQRFLEWQRQQVLAPGAEESLRSRHELALRRLLSLGRMLNGATSDPEFMDPRAAQIVKARLAQLQESWDLTHPRMTAETSHTLLLFPIFGRP